MLKTEYFYFFILVDFSTLKTTSIQIMNEKEHSVQPLPTHYIT